jgi:hypothetical protein
MPDEAGVIRFELGGTWKAAELAQLLASIDGAYRLIFAVVEDGVRPYLPLFYSRPDPFWGTNLAWRWLAQSPPWVGPSDSQAMRIHRVRLSSPGLVELVVSGMVVGRLLRVIADFITNWRRENTLRRAVEAGEKAADNRTQADLLNLVVDARRERGRGDELDDTERAVLKIAEGLLIEPARDARVTKVEMRPSGPSETKGQK